MATRSTPLQSHAEFAGRRARRRRGGWWLLAAVLTLGVYASAVLWLTRRVEAGVERSIQPLPALLHERGHDAN